MVSSRALLVSMRTDRERGELLQRTIVPFRIRIRIHRGRVERTRRVRRRRSSVRSPGAHTGSYLDDLWLLRLSPASGAGERCREGAGKLPVRKLGEVGPRDRGVPSTPR